MESKLHTLTPGYIRIDTFMPPSNHNIGMIRYDGIGNRIEVMNGREWSELPCKSVNISLTSRAEEILMWVENKMLEEQEEKELLEKYPALQKAKEEYLLIKRLVSNHKDK